jgi:hypothetical protein
MTAPLIDLRHHGRAGWTWAVYYPGRVTVWRTDEAGHGLQRLVPDPAEPAGEPCYRWVDHDPSGTFVLSPDRARALAEVRAAFATAPTPGPRTLPAPSDHAAAVAVP